MTPVTNKLSIVVSDSEVQNRKKEETQPGSSCRHILDTAYYCIHSDETKLEPFSHAEVWRRQRERKKTRATMMNAFS